jgi:hypothetical protein
MFRPDRVFIRPLKCTKVGYPNRYIYRSVDRNVTPKTVIITKYDK